MSRLLAVRILTVVEFDRSHGARIHVQREEVGPRVVADGVEVAFGDRDLRKIDVRKTGGRCITAMRGMCDLRWHVEIVATATMAYGTRSGTHRLPRAEQYIHDRIVRPVTNVQTVMRDAFAKCAYSVRHAVAGLITGRNDKFEADQVGFPEREIGQCAHRGCGDAASGCGGAHPVAEIGQPVLRPQLVEAAAAQQPACLVDDREVVFGRRLPCIFTMRDPRTTVLERISRMTPGQPGRYTVDRLQHGFEQCICVRGSVPSDCHWSNIKSRRRERPVSQVYASQSQSSVRQSLP